MKIQTPLLLILMTFFMGCASGPTSSPYLVNPTPIEKGVTKYELSDVEVQLTLGHGAREGDTQFVDEATLNTQFEAALTEALQQHGVLSTSSSTDAKLAIKIDYHRTYNVGGNSLNYPKISHSVKVFNDGQGELAKLSQANYHLTRGIGANLKIAAFKWKAEEELADVKLIANLIAKDIAALGR